MAYTLTNETYRRLKGRLTRAINSGDPVKVKTEVQDAFKIFEEQGYPDDWSRWQRAADDAVWGGREERAMSRLAINFVQPPARQTKKAKAEWVAWFKTVGPEQFLDVFLHTVENAESMCVQCGQPIYVDVLIGGGAPDWSTEDGDFGCDMSPETTEEGVGSHRPRKRGDR